jgi:hypothetical protein
MELVVITSTRDGKAALLGYSPKESDRHHRTQLLRDHSYITNLPFVCVDIFNIS